MTAWAFKWKLILLTPFPYQHGVLVPPFHTNSIHNYYIFPASNLFVCKWKIVFSLFSCSSIVRLISVHLCGFEVEIKVEIIYGGKEREGCYRKTLRCSFVETSILCCHRQRKLWKNFSSRTLILDLSRIWCTERLLPSTHFIPLSMFFFFQPFAAVLYVNAVDGIALLLWCCEWYSQQKCFEW